MNPILLGRDAAEALRRRVRHSFITSSPAFEGMIDDFLAADNAPTGPERRRRKANFLQGPFISIDMPFRSASGGEPFPEVPLGFPPHAHQARAFERLAAPAPRSTLVATGTGSGKTESYLWPILDHCRRTLGEKGIKAIIIYPMNALATDQARRIAKAIATIPALKGVRCGLYADAEPLTPSDLVTAEEVITRRATMRDDPPDILLTNYKMLDRLLLHPRDLRLWAANKPETLRYLVVDELHTFDGAQGADLAMLIRRLKDRLAVPAGQLACVGSSATLGTGEAARAALTDYATTIFGEPFDAVAVVTENRKSVTELYPDVDEDQLLDTLPSPGAIVAALEDAASETQPQAAASLAALFFPWLNPKLGLMGGDPADDAWRVALGEALMRHFAVKRLLTALAERKGPSTLDEIGKGLATSADRFPGFDETSLPHLAEALVSLISWARRAAPAPGRQAPPLFSVRVQYWARELGRMAATLPRVTDDRPARVSLHHSQDVDPNDLKHMLPVIHCSQCGTTGHVGMTAARTASLWAPLKDIYESYFEGATDRLRFIYHEPVQRQRKGAGGKVVEGYLAADLSFRAMNEGRGDDDSAIRVWLYNPVEGRRVDKTCPGCASPTGLQLLGLRAARLTASLATTLFSSAHNEVAEDAKPRLLLFSDSVQDAAQRAAVAEMRNSADVMRLTLLDAISTAPGRERSLAEIIKDVPQERRAELGDKAFVARHIAREQTWRDGYQALARDKDLPDGSLVDNVALRLGWEFFSDLTYRAHASQTLQTSRLAVAEMDPDVVADIAERLSRRLPMISDRIALSPTAANAFLTGLLRQMRRRGAVAHDYVRFAIEGADKRGLSWFSALRRLGVHATRPLPIPDGRTSAAPLPPTLRRSALGFESLTASSAANWYTYWADRFFLDALDVELYEEIYRAALDLAAEGPSPAIIAATATQGAGGAPPVKAFLLDPASVVVSREVSVLACDACAWRETVLADAVSAEPVPCTRIGCAGHMRAFDADRPADPAHHRLHRVVAREHTGILETDARRQLERDFISGEDPWDPNLVSATPTLEMGIDIGDLSTLVLCQVPPEAANYVQRIGRSGRRDGNSLNLTLVAARPHDLEYWEWPWAMLTGEVSPPGVHLRAAAVLRRQAAAYCLDRFVGGAVVNPPDYGKVRDVINALDTGGGPFVSAFFGLLERDGRAIADAFVRLLPEFVQADAALGAALSDYVYGSTQHSLRADIHKAFDDARIERADLLKLQDDIDAERKRLRRLSPPPGDLEKKLQDLKDEREQIGHSIRVSINDVGVLEFMTNRGLLPNYAFPEEGAKLKSIIMKRPEGGGPGPAKPMIQEFVRPASSALGEFAPFQTFYANGRGVTVSRIDMGRGDLADWRFCPRCSHNERDTPTPVKTCPRCGAEGWSDKGAVAKVVTLRSVAAVSTEERAAIRELDDRQGTVHDRAMFPSHQPEAIRFAWSADDADGPPFGFEFIDQCEFREINFGERSRIEGQMIAGDPRPARPFVICRKCGRLQRRMRTDPGPGDDHQRACEALRNMEDASDWARDIYLMRSFNTEAVRVVLPVTRQADHDEIKSFVAAIEIGIRAHFSGRIDHLKSTVVEETIGSEAKLRSLYLYDSVPGGSGYLRQLVETPETMRNVFIQARDILADCSCQHDDDRNGCYRCVRGYRMQFGPGEPRRDVALAFVEQVLAGWQRLRKTERIDDTIRDRVVESELEKRFLDALATRFGPDALKQKFVDWTRRAYQLTIGDGADAIHWDVEAQVDIQKEGSYLPKRRVDFLLRPRGDMAVKPIAVELDGWETHASTVTKDVETRLAIIRGGALTIWTLTWDDFGEAAPEIPNPLDAKALGLAFESVCRTFWSKSISDDFSLFRENIDSIFDTRARSPGVSSENDAITGTSLGALFHRLASPNKVGGEAPAVALRLAVGRGEDLLQLSQRLQLDDDSQLFLAEAQCHRVFDAAGLVVIAGVPLKEPSSHATRVVVRADIAETTTASDVGAKPQWRGFWRLFNLLQDLPSFHAIVPGQTLGAPQVRSDGVGWVVDPDVEDMLDPPARAVMQALIDDKVPPPSSYYEDLIDGDAVAGLGEFIWRDARVALVREAIAIEGWTLVGLEDRDDAPIRHTIDSLLEALKISA